MAKEKFTAQQVIDALRKRHSNKSATARLLKTSRPTIDRYIRTYPTVKAAYEEGREELIDFTEDKLFQAVESGNIAAIIFTLKTIGKHRGYVERQEVTGADGGAIEIGDARESVQRKLDCLATDTCTE